MPELLSEFSLRELEDASPHGVLKLSIGINLQSPLPGEHNLRNLLGAVKVALGLGLTPKEISEGVKRFKPLFGRSVLTELRSGIWILEDYYNANPDSVRAAFNSYQELLSTHDIKRRILCLGEMLELGEGTKEFHEGLAGPIIKVGFEKVCLVGELMRVLYLKLKQERQFFDGVFWYESSTELGDALKTEEVRVGDFFLIKGSRGTKMELVAQALNAI